MTTIEIDVPAELADNADALRRAIVELLDAAADEGDMSVAFHDGRMLLVEAKSGDITPQAHRASGKSAALVQLLEYVSRNPAGLSAVSGLLETLTVRQDVLRHVTDTVANQPVPLGPATAGQVALVDQSWRGIEARYGVLDAGLYAQLVGAAPTSRSVASKAKSKGLVGYRRGRRLLYPGYQFDERGLRPGWNGIVAPLRDAGWEDEDIVLWLAAPHGSLGRRSPVEALDEGNRDLVLALIVDETAGVW